MEPNLSSYINPRGDERISYDEMFEMTPGAMLRLHNGEVRAYVSLNHPGTDTDYPFVRLESVAWTRNKSAYSDGSIIGVERMHLFAMPSQTKDAGNNSAL